MTALQTTPGKPLLEQCQLCLTWHAYNVGDLWPALATYGDLYITDSTDGSNLLVYGSLVDTVHGDASSSAATPGQ